MKLFFALALSICSTVLFSQIPTAGLIGAWTFSGNANDVSGNGNNGTVFGATLTADRCGNANSAYMFDGFSSYIVTTSSGPLGTSPRSVTFWVKYTNTSLSPAVAFDYGFISTSGSGPTCFQIMSNYNCVGFGVDVSTAAFIRGPGCVNNGAWHHVAAVYHGTNTAYGSTQIFIDGILQNQNCTVSGTTTAMNTQNSQPVTIGRSAHASNRFFTGALDDFYFYNVALTPQQVMQSYTTTMCGTPIFGNPVICSMGAQNYSIAPISNALGYTWTLPAGWSGSSNSNVISVAPGTSGGTMSVSVTTSCGVPVTGSLALTVGPSTNVLTVNSSNSLVCSGSSVVLTAGGSQNYNWMPGNISANSILVNPASTQVYTLSGACASPVTYTQSVAQLPTISVSPSVTGLCFNQPATFTAGGASTYTWLPSNQTGAVMILTPSTSVSFTVLGKDANGCLSSKTNSYGILPNPQVNINTTNSLICPGASATLSAFGALSYTWLPGNTVSTNIVVNPSVNSIYTVTGTSSNGCRATATITQLMHTLPQIQVSSSNTELCRGAVTSLASNGAMTYTWMPGNQNGFLINVNPLVTTAYTVTGTDQNGCKASTIFTVLVKGCTSLNEATQADAGIKIAPNPSSGRFDITGLSAYYEAVLLDVQGRVIRKYELAGNELSIDISDEAAGVYFLKTSSDKSWKITRLLKTEN